MANQPTFIDIGPGRCGTSWLFNNLSAHPAIAMSNVKETEYFNTHLCEGYGRYEAHFPVANTAVGEISNNYYLDAEVARRIAVYNPNMKIIFNVRYPYSLLWSTYQFGIRRGYDFGGLDKTLSEPIGRIMGSGYEQRLRTGTTTVADSMTLLDAVLLERRLRPFLAAFPRPNIYLMIYERIDADTDTLLAELYRFLGVDANFRPTSAKTVVNAAAEPRSRPLARLTTSISYTLRRKGAHRLLSRLHQSVAIKRFLYKLPVARHNSEATRAMLSKAAQQMIDSDMRRLLQSFPSLSLWWPMVMHSQEPQQTVFQK